MVTVYWDTHTHTHTGIHIHVYMYVCVCVCVYDQQHNGDESPQTLFSFNLIFFGAYTFYRFSE
jgi:hypothetical protein